MRKCRTRRRLLDAGWIGGVSSHGAASARGPDLHRAEVRGGTTPHLTATTDYFVLFGQQGFGRTSRPGGCRADRAAASTLAGWLFDVLAGRCVAEKSHPKRELGPGTVTGNCSCFCARCSQRFSASMCYAGLGPGTDHVIFTSKIASVQCSQAAHSLCLGASLSERDAGRRPGLEGGGFPQTGRVLAAESAVALRASPAAARLARASSLPNQ